MMPRLRITRGCSHLHRQALNIPDILKSFHGELFNSAEIKF